MTTEVVDTAEFSMEEMVLLQKLGHVSNYPGVLEIWAPDYYWNPDLPGSEEEGEAEARENLTKQGVINSDGVADPTIAHWLRILQRPDIELDARTWKDGERLQLCVCRRGPAHVVAMQYNGLIMLQPLDEGTEITGIGQICGPLFSVLGSAEIPTFEPVNLRVSEAAAIDKRVADEGADFYSELREVGASESAARFLTENLSDPHKMYRSEISLLQYVPGKSILGSLGVGVFDTMAGRIVATPRRSIDDQAWTTFMPGTNVRIAEAVEQAIQTVPSKDWFAAARG